MFRTSVVCSGHQLYVQDISCVQYIRCEQDISCMFRTSVVFRTSASSEVGTSAKLVREAASSSSNEDQVDISGSDLRIG